MRCAIRGRLASRWSRVVDLFRAMDKDGSGTISPADFRKALLELRLIKADESDDEIEEMVR